jgi:hypothetical protein
VVVVFVPPYIVFLVQTNPTVEARQIERRERVSERGEEALSTLDQTAVVEVTLYAVKRAGQLNEQAAPGFIQRSCNCVSKNISIVRFHEMLHSILRRAMHGWPLLDALVSAFLVMLIYSRSFSMLIQVHNNHIRTRVPDTVV